MADTPYGEAIEDKHMTTYENPFKFSAKELDDITGLYDHGARSRNPISTLWYGIDPLFEKYPDFSPYNYCAGNPVKLVDPDGRAHGSLIEYRGNGIFGINKKNLSSTTNFYMNQMNNNPSYWNKGEIGLNTTVFSLKINQKRYTAKPAGIEPKDANKTYNFSFAPIAKSTGNLDKRYKNKTINVFSSTGIGVSAFSRFSLLIDAFIKVVDFVNSYNVSNDINTLRSNALGLDKSFRAVQKYLKNGGILPAEYDNEEGIGRLVNYVFQGESGTNFNCDSNGNYTFDTIIMEIGNQILEKNGRYDKENGKPNFFINE